MGTGTAINYRFTQAYGFLEWRMNTLMPDEESRITGKAYSSLIFIGPEPNVGDTAQVTFSGGGLSSPLTLTLTATQELLDVAQPTSADQAAWATRLFNANIGLGLASQMAALIAKSPEMVLAGFVAIAPYGTGPYSQLTIPVPEVGITNDTPFTMTVANSGQMAVQVESGGDYLNPSISPAAMASPVYGYVPILNYLETQYGNSIDILQIDTADVFKARKTVLAETFSLYQTWVQRLAEFMLVPVNPEAKGNFGRTVPGMYR